MNSITFLLILSIAALCGIVVGTDEEERRREATDFILETQDADDGDAELLDLAMRGNNNNADVSKTSQEFRRISKFDRDYLTAYKKSIESLLAQNGRPWLFQSGKRAAAMVHPRKWLFNGKRAAATLLQKKPWFKFNKRADVVDQHRKWKIQVDKK